MIWTGFAVLLIVPLAFIVICTAVWLEQSGVMALLRRLWHGVRRWLR